MKSGACEAGFVFQRYCDKGTPAAVFIEINEAKSLGAGLTLTVVHRLSTFNPVIA